MPKPISALITGANRGLGLEMVRQILETYCPLSVLFTCCRDLARAEELQALAKKHPDVIKVIQMDSQYLNCSFISNVADLDSIKQAAAQVAALVGQSGLNLVINNAAVAVNSLMLKSTPEDMLSCYKTSGTNEFLPLRVAVKDSGMPCMSCRKAAVVNISTIISSNECVKYIYNKLPEVPYRASKAALNMITSCASLELQKEEILCALIHPGWGRTQMGGPEADIDLQESIQGVLHVMNSMTDEHHGALVDYKGQTIPW